MSCFCCITVQQVLFIKSVCISVMLAMAFSKFPTLLTGMLGPSRIGIMWLPCVRLCTFLETPAWPNVSTSYQNKKFIPLILLRRKKHVLFLYTPTTNQFLVSIIDWLGWELVEIIWSIISCNKVTDHWLIIDLRWPPGTIYWWEEVMCIGTSWFHFVVTYLIHQIVVVGWLLFVYEACAESPEGH